jgi:hypothetical protein
MKERALRVLPGALSHILGSGNSTGAGIAAKSEYRNPKSETIPKSKCSTVKIDPRGTGFGAHRTGEVCGADRPEY